MSKRSSVSLQQSQGNQLGLRQTQILLTGVGIAFSLAAILLIQDISYLGVNVSELAAKPLVSQVRPGEQFRYEISVLRLSPGETIGIQCELPEGLVFVPGSLGAGEDEPDMMVSNYGGKQILRISELAGELSDFRLEVGIQALMDLDLAGKNLEINTEYIWRGQHFKIDPHQTQAEILVSLPQLLIQPHMTEGKWGHTPKLGCEVAVRNPLDGLAMDEWGLPLEVEIELENSAWTIDPASIQIQGGWEHEAPSILDNRLIINQLILPQGEMLNVAFDVNPGEVEPESPPFMLGRARVRLAGSDYETSELLRYREIPVQWGSEQVVMEKNLPVLHWETLSEHRTDHFEIEHSTDGATFLQIGSVEKKRKPDQRQAYEFVLPEMPLGEHIFRIKQISVDGNICNGRLIYWNHDAAQLPQLNISSSLITDLGEVRIQVPYRQRVRLEVWDEMNQPLQVLFSGILQPESGFQAVITASEWKSGTYTFVLTTKQGKQRKTVLIGQEERREVPLS